MSVTVTIDTSELNAVFENLIDDDTMLRVHEVLAETIDPWTPFLTGQLSEDVSVTSDGITYNVPYASEKYNGEVYCKEFHPLATSHWDEVAMETEFDNFALQVKDILIERAKELYG